MKFTKILGFVFSEGNVINIQNVFYFVIQSGIIISSGGITDERIILIKLFCEGN